MLCEDLELTDIRKKFGLDYLKGGSQGRAPAEPPRQQPFLDDALIAYGWRVLDSLRQARPGTKRLYVLIDELKMPIDVALKVVEQLEARKYVEIVAKDLKGDHELRVTEDGVKFLAA